LAGIYIHIPFCKQACHYCNFHFATSLRHKNELVAALLKEIVLRRDYFGFERIDTIYFGGGTPSLLELHQLTGQLQAIRSVFDVAPDAEITLEANPDDIVEEKLRGWKEAGINRLSIGVQSFFEEDLKWMNRAHSSGQSVGSLQSALQQFENITIDLIYGTPLLTNEKWKQNVDKAIQLNIPHLSCYALTVEPRTPLQKMINAGNTPDINSDKQSEQFLLLMQWMEEAGYEHYEISNFAKPASASGTAGFRSRHNSSYWQGKKYLGIGPSAHSFNGTSRQWNISNNNVYIESINKGLIPFEKEELTPTQKVNEYIMTALRTIEGVDLNKIDDNTSDKLIRQTRKYVERGLLFQRDRSLILTNQGKLLADGIAADLFQ
jgi:oxygen-independent coproporphyrinogen III oxidase